MRNYVYGKMSYSPLPKSIEKTTFSPIIPTGASSPIQATLAHLAAPEDTEFLSIWESLLNLRVQSSDLGGSDNLSAEFLPDTF